MPGSDGSAQSSQAATEGGKVEKVGNMPFAFKKIVAKKLHLLLGAKLFNRTAICLNINFHIP